MKKDITKIKTKEEARQEAIDFLNTFNENSYSMGELMDFGTYFKELGEKFNLTEEFTEEGII